MPSWGLLLCEKQEVILLNLLYIYLQVIVHIFTGDKSSEVFIKCYAK